MSGNVITETWLAWALDRPADEAGIRSALERVDGHYGAQLAEPPPLHAGFGPSEGMALWRHHDERLRWPGWAEEGGLASAWASVPVDWRRLVDEPDPGRAAIELGRELARRPERAAELSPPLLAGVRELDDAGGSALTIVGDFAGAGRLYELRFDSGPLGAGSVWSNRLGALPIFAGIAPRADRRAWLLFAAAGWFISDTTAIDGARKVTPGTAIRVSARAGEGAQVDRVETAALAGLLAPREHGYADSLELAAADAVALARGIGEAYADPPRIDLSGGRDSRVSAAGAVAAGIDCEMRTGDLVPGELEIARKLVESAPGDLRHMVSAGESGEPSDELEDRLRTIHAVHDGMRNPQELRRAMPLPIPVRSRRPSMSGHGGEIAHGFYYTSEKALREVEEAGDAGLVARLDKAARRKAPAARDEAYELHRDEVSAIFDQGRAIGIQGPNLLDFFYLAHRLAYRSGLGARSNRYSACATPGFVRASFDLTPDERVANRLHKELIPRLVPEWAAVPFLDTHAKPALPEMSRDWLWDKPGHAEHAQGVIEAGGAWEELFDPRQVRKMWRRARKGKGHRHFETIFNRVVWREAFDDHLGALARAAGTQRP